MMVWRFEEGWVVERYDDIWELDRSLSFSHAVGMYYTRDYLS